MTMKKLKTWMAAIIDDALISYYTQLNGDSDGPCGPVQAWARKNRPEDNIDVEKKPAL